MRRAAPLKRHAPLRAAPGKSLKRNPPHKQEAGSALAWRVDLGPCAVCAAEGSECRGPVQGHHIIPKSTLRKHGLLAAMVDLRNRLPVCEYRHEQHTTRCRPIPRELLPPSVFEFAKELGLSWYLDRFYPAAPSAKEAA